MPALIQMSAQPSIFWMSVFGLIVGSFMNVVIHRLPYMVLTNGDDENGTVDLCFPASHCPSCHSPLKIWHNIPVLSFVLLRGKCGFCKSAISWRYPLVELGIALWWGYCAFAWTHVSESLSWAVFGSVLVALAVIDAQTKLLPDLLTQPLLWFGLLASASGWINVPLREAVWGAALGYLSLSSFAWIFLKLTKKDGMGAGDFKLLAALGVWVGVSNLMPLLLIACLLCLCSALFWKWILSKQLDAEIPFGPFLATAGFVMAVTPLSFWRI